MTIDPANYVRPGNAAKIAGVTRAYIVLFCNDGRIGCFRVCNSWFVSRTDAEKFRTSTPGKLPPKAQLAPPRKQAPIDPALSVADGAITAASTAAVTVGGTTTARTFTATPAALNAYFKALGTIGYTTALDNTIPRTLTTTVSDGALSTSASTTIAITPVNDAPKINLTAALGGGKIGTPYEITYETLRTALNAADDETAAPTLVIPAIKSGSLQKWSGTAWVTVATTAGVPQRSLSLSEGQRIRWLPPAGVSGAQQAFDVKARDGLLYSTTTAKVTISLAQA